jgi:hypothetical protein
MLMAEVWRRYDISTYEPETQSDEIADGHVEDPNDEMDPE